MGNTLACYNTAIVTTVKSFIIQAWFKCGQKNLDHFQAKKLGGYLKNFLQTSLDDFYGISLYLQTNFEIEILIISSVVNTSNTVACALNTVTPLEA